MIAYLAFLTLTWGYSDVLDNLLSEELSAVDETLTYEPATLHEGLALQLEERHGVSYWDAEKGDFHGHVYDRMAATQRQLGLARHVEMMELHDATTNQFIKDHLWKTSVAEFDFLYPEDMTDAEKEDAHAAVWAGIKEHPGDQTESLDLLMQEWHAAEGTALELEQGPKPKSRDAGRLYRSDSAFSRRIMRDLGLKNKVVSYLASVSNSNSLNDHNSSKERGTMSSKVRNCCILRVTVVCLINVTIGILLGFLGPVGALCGIALSLIGMPDCIGAKIPCGQGDDENKPDPNPLMALGPGFVLRVWNCMVNVVCRGAIGWCLRKIGLGSDDCSEWLWDRNAMFDRTGPLATAIKDPNSWWTQRKQWLESEGYQQSLDGTWRASFPADFGAFDQTPSENQPWLGSAVELDSGLGLGMGSGGKSCSGRMGTCYGPERWDPIGKFWSCDDEFATTVPCGSTAAGASALEVGNWKPCCGGDASSGFGTKKCDDCDCHGKCACAECDKHDPKKVGSGCAPSGVNYNIGFSHNADFFSNACGRGRCFGPNPFSSGGHYNGEYGLELKTAEDEFMVSAFEDAENKEYRDDLLSQVEVMEVSTDKWNADGSYEMNQADALEMKAKAKTGGKVKSAIHTALQTFATCFLGGQCGKAVGYTDSNYWTTYLPGGVKGDIQHDVRENLKMPSNYSSRSSNLVMMIVKNCVGWVNNCLKCLSQETQGTRVGRYTKHFATPAKKGAVSKLMNGATGSKMFRLRAKWVWDFLNRARVYKGAIKFLGKGVPLVGLICVFDIIASMIAPTIALTCEHKLIG